MFLFAFLCTTRDVWEYVLVGYIYQNNGIPQNIPMHAVAPCVCIVVTCHLRMYILV